MFSKNYLKNLNNNMLNLRRVQEQMSTGKEILRASDDPILVGKVMGMKDNIVENEQYNNSIGSSLAWVRTQDSALDGASASLRRVKDLTISGAKDSLAEEDRNAIAGEIREEIKNLRDIFNTNFDGRYIFSGQNTLERPYEVDDNGILTYNTGEGSDKNLIRQISRGVTVELVTNGGELTTVTGDNVNDGKSLGHVLEEIAKHVEEGNVEELSNVDLDKLDAHMDNVSRVRSQIGAIDNRLEAAKDKNTAENINLKSVLTEKEDVDVVEKYIEAITLSTVYQASLSIGTKVLQPSLLDYLR